LASKYGQFRPTLYVMSINRAITLDLKQQKSYEHVWSMVTFIGNFYWTFILCNFYVTLTPCMTLNCALHYSNNMPQARSKRSSQVANFELVFLSSEVVMVDWFSAGWL